MTLNVFQVRRIASLASSLVLGQGSFFVLQTAIIAHGLIDLTAPLAAAIAILSLVQWLSDWGGAAILPSLGSGHKKAFSLEDANCCRLIGAAVIAFCCLLISFAWTTADPVITGAFRGGVFLPAIWAFNLSGYLDGRADGALLGPYQGAPWLVSSTAMALAIFSMADFTRMELGILLGASFSIGCLVCVIRQYRFLGQLGVSSSIANCTKECVLSYFRQGGAYVIGELPYQLYARVLLVFVAARATPSIAGAYAYARQLISAANQMISVIRRVEIVALNELSMMPPRKLEAIVVYKRIKLSFVASIVFLLGSATAVATSDFWASAGSLSRFKAPLPLVLWMALSTPLWVVSSALGQMLISKGRVGIYSKLLLLSVVASACGSFALVDHLGVVVIPVLDFLSFLFLIGSYWSALEEREPEPSELKSRSLSG